MSLVQKTCATCCAFEPVRGCWALTKPSRQPDLNGCCEHHQTEMESDVLEGYIHAFWQPLLIKSHRMATTQTRRSNDTQGGTTRPASKDAY